jgi:hypothetical protein
MPEWRPQVIIDGTGIGRGVCDMFSAAGVDHFRIQITGGEKSTWGYKSANVSKTELISAMQAPLDSGDLQFAKGLREAPVLKNELLDFQRKITESGRATYSARATAHDDIILSIAQACWFLTIEPVEAKFSNWGMT